MKVLISRALLVLVLVVSPVLIAPDGAGAQEISRSKPGLVITPGETRIMVMRPAIKVGELSTGGLFEPNAEWTDTAKKHLDDALVATMTAIGVKTVPMPEPVGGAAEVQAQYRALFPVVASAVMTYQYFPGNRLPTKKRAGVFDYTLGSGIKAMPGADDADYALFLFTEDAFGSAGRKTAQVFAAMLGAAIVPGIHTGYAGLVDLKTGDLVWLNADPQMGGDVREADGAAKRMSQLLAGFPGAMVDPASLASPTAATPSAAR